MLYKNRIIGWRELQIYKFCKLMFNLFSSNLVTNRFNLKTFIVRERVDQYVSGTVHYQNPLINQLIQIDQYGCAKLKANKMSNLCATNNILAANEDDLYPIQKCQIISRQSTKQEAYIFSNQQKTQMIKPIQNGFESKIVNPEPSPEINYIQKVKKICKPNIKRPTKGTVRQIFGVATRSAMLNNKRLV